MKDIFCPIKYGWSIRYLERQSVKTTRFIGLIYLLRTLKPMARDDRAKVEERMP